MKYFIFIFLVFLISCNSSKNNSSSTTTTGFTANTLALKANLKNAVNIAIVNETQSARIDLNAVRLDEDKNDKTLCENFSAKQLEETETKLDIDNKFIDNPNYVKCDNPNPLHYCEEIEYINDKLSTGRVKCQIKPLKIGDLIVVNTDGEVNKVLPNIPSWNSVKNIKTSEKILLVELKYPLKLLNIEGNAEYCDTLYYNIDKTNSNVTPYCYKYSLSVDYNGRDIIDYNKYILYGIDPKYSERLLNANTGEFYIYSDIVRNNYLNSNSVYSVKKYITENAIFERVRTREQQYKTRIVTGNIDGLYDLDFDSVSTKGIFTKNLYRTFDSNSNLIEKALSSTPISAADKIYEFDKKVIIGLSNNNQNQTFLMNFSKSTQYLQYRSNDPERTWIGSGLIINPILSYFDLNTLEESNIDIKFNNNCSNQYCYFSFIGTAQKKLFFEIFDNNTAKIYSTELNRNINLDTLSPRLITTQDSYSSFSIITTKNYTILHNLSSTKGGTNFHGILLKSDGTAIDLTASSLGFYVNSITTEDDEIIINGVKGLTSVTYKINPLDTTITDELKMSFKKVTSSSGTYETQEAVVNKLIPLE